MLEAQNVTGPGATGQQRFHRMLDAAVGEFAQERIARAQRKKRQRRRLAGFGLREKTVHNLERSTVAANRDKSPVAANIGSPRQFRGFALSGGLRDFQLNSPGSQAFERGLYQLAAASATGGRIHHREIGGFHNATTAARPALLRISSARAVRLIFMDAVRGKSSLDSRYPPTRLKSGSPRLQASIAVFSSSVNSWLGSRRRMSSSVSCPRLFSGHR